MRILVVSPHPDDETLGAGGTLLKLKKENHSISWLNITDMKAEYGWGESAIHHRKEQIELVNSFYGFSSFFNLSLPPANLSSLEKSVIIDMIRDVYHKIEPEWIIIPGHYDAHSDHQVVYDCCMVCAKTFRAPFIKRITTMEIISETDYGFSNELFRPNLFVDISDEMDMKLEAMKIYDTEIDSSPFPRSLDSIRALGIVRGASCGKRYAEAFTIIKQME